MIGGEQQDLEVELPAHDVDGADLVEAGQLFRDFEGRSAPHGDADGQHQVVARFEEVGHGADPQLAPFQHAVDPGRDGARGEVEGLGEGPVRGPPVAAQELDDSLVGSVHVSLAPTPGSSGRECTNFGSEGFYSTKYVIQDYHIDRFRRSIVR